MSFPPLWKVRREIWRVIGKMKVSLMKFRGAQSAISYRGLTIPINRSGMNSEIVLAMAREHYEDPEIRGLQKCVKDGDRVLELGSGLGVITALAGRAAAPSGQVLSFEANPNMIPDTMVFLKDHDITNVDLRHAVLVPNSAPGETRTFHLTGSFASSSLLVDDNRKNSGSIVVPTAQLMDVVTEFKPNVLLCDIEGGEAELIPALDASGLRAVVMELHPDRLSEDQLQSIHDALTQYGLEKSKSVLGGTVVMYLRPS